MNASLLEAPPPAWTLPETVRAVVVLGFDEAAEVREVTKPIPGRGEIVTESQRDRRSRSS